MAAVSLPQAVEKLVTAINANDSKALLAVFAPDATVADDGKTWTGETQIREWIGPHLIEPKLIVTPTSYDGNRLVASINGEFPGGPQTFAFDFTLQDDAIAHVSIEPA